MSADRQNSKTRLHFKVAGQPFGVYTWSRNFWRTGGVVFRVGPLGHVQLQHFRCQLVGKHVDGRRGKHGLSISWWGINGRRRKRKIEVAVHL